ncbi:MAG: type II toxin-antitoxin system HicA family toxin [Adlercreutzia equolifaciens]
MKFFKEEGFVLVKGTNHDRLVHPDGRWTTLGRHTEIGNRLFDEMKKQAGLK